MPTPDYIEIPLTQGQVARASAHRRDDLLKKKWHAVWMPLANAFYAAAKFNGRRIFMHRYILGLAIGDPREGDHADHNPLNNTDENLRITDRFGQTRNQRMKKTNPTGFKGVRKNKRGIRWRATICVNRKRIFLGNFLTPEEAARAYDQAAIRNFGEFAHLNFPTSSGSGPCQ